MKARLLDIFLAIALLAVVVSGFAHTWIQTGAAPSPPWGGIGVSADGRIICAVSSESRPVISTDGGQNWALATNAPSTGGGYLGGAAVSADGTRVFAILENAGGLRVFLSTNYGDAWMLTAAPTGTCVACSGDGGTVIAASAFDPGGFVYVSTNGGTDWNMSAAPVKKWTAVASSKNGRQFIGAVSLEKLYISTNSGANWTPANTPNKGWRSVCSSADGQLLAATASDSTYISTNSGGTWSSNTIAGQSIACSADGTKVIVGGGQVYTSADGGLTWVTNSPPPSGNWYCAAASADGCKFIVGSRDGIWIGQVTPSPQLNIQPINSGLAVSWLTPSTNFVLQQNLDLGTTNWIALTNHPILNFTNLYQEVGVPEPTNKVFYRLTTQ